MQKKNIHPMFFFFDSNFIRVPKHLYTQMEFRMMTKPGVTILELNVK